MMKPKYGVDVYKHGHYDGSIKFGKRWQAVVFHVLLNRSTSGHAGVRRY